MNVFIFENLPQNPTTTQKLPCQKINLVITKNEIINCIQEYIHVRSHHNKFVMKSRVDPGNLTRPTIGEGLCQKGHDP